MDPRKMRKSLGVLTLSVGLATLVLLLRAKGVERVPLDETVPLGETSRVLVSVRREDDPSVTDVRAETSWRPATSRRPATLASDATWLSDEERTKFLERSEQLRDACRQLRARGNALKDASGKFENPDYVEYVSQENFYLSRSASTMTCPINKVASTSVVVALLGADDRPIPHWTDALSPHNAAAVLKPQTPEEFNFARKNFFKFLLVRHPFDRLLSAYRDKVERANHKSLVELREHIFWTLTGVKVAPARSSPPPKNETKEKNETVTTEAPEENIPTFSDFLEYILKTNYSGGGFDSHWTPYWRTCSPCSIDYHIIAKLETADQDLKPVGKRMGLLWASLPLFNRSGDGNSTSDVLRRHYGALRPDLIGRVYRRYAPDFRLFRYDVMDVFRRGGHCRTRECSEMATHL